MEKTEFLDMTINFILFSLSCAAKYEDTFSLGICGRYVLRLTPNASHPCTQPMSFEWVEAVIGF